MKYKILFVCLGNICRSSAAEEIMRQKIRKAGGEDSFFVDSAGLISYHQGEMADPRMRMHAKRRGYDITHLSRPVKQQDFYDFDLIVGMDASNIDRLHCL
jgi:protein-tyrosine phosphatase